MAWPSSYFLAFSYPSSAKWRKGKFLLNFFYRFAVIVQTDSKWFCTTLYGCVAENASLAHYVGKCYA